MNEKRENLINIEEGLTPESAEGRGYVWWKDVIYDKEAPIETMKDILELKGSGYFFGECVTPDGQTNNYIGVYKKASMKLA